jgi:hypothetical protein
MVNYQNWKLEIVVWSTEYFGVWRIRIHIHIRQAVEKVTRNHVISAVFTSTGQPPI